MNNKKIKNIVMIISDDQGYWSLGSYGNKEIQTPNLDKLAKSGVRYENFFCASPVCSPARASILTGKIPSQHGVHDWLTFDNAEKREIEYLKNQSTYVDKLSQNGWICGLSGKWHLGAPSKPQQGFSHWFCHIGGGGTYYNAKMFRDGSLETEKEYITDVITDDAISFIKENKDKPFYLHVGYTAPHSPWLNNHPKKYTDMYQSCPFKSVPHLKDLHPNRIALTDEVFQKERDNLIGYYASVTAMDENIGRIIKELKEQNIEDQTAIIFLSDNGFSCGHHGFWGKGNGTFPLNLYDVTVKVPCIVFVPGVTPTEITTMHSAYDIRPTILDLVDIKDKCEEKLPGKSFVNEWLSSQGDSKSDNDTIVIFDEYGPNRMIRTKVDKLIKRYPYGPDEYYDLVEDETEKINLIDEESKAVRIEDLNNQLENWFSQYVHPNIDGSKEPVWGSGQNNLANHGKKTSYELADYIKETSWYNNLKNN